MINNTAARKRKNTNAREPDSANIRANLAANFDLACGLEELKDLLSFGRTRVDRA